MKERRTLKPGTGIATILLIFVVLAMTILAVLSYLHASQNHQSVTRQIEYAQAYSEAEAQAAYLQDQVKHGHFENVESNEEGYTYSIEKRTKPFCAIRQTRQCSDLENDR